MPDTPFNDHLARSDGSHIGAAVEDIDGDLVMSLIRSTHMPMVLSDPHVADNPIVFANAAFLDLTGYARDEIVGRNCRFLQGEATDRTEIARLAAAIADGTPIRVDLLNCRKDGSEFWNRLFVGPVRGTDGEIRFFFAAQIDVTDQMEARAATARQRETIEAEVVARTADLEAVLREKERLLEERTILLHEVDHRVKNNLTMVGSLIRMHGSRIDDPALKRTLASMMERIDALSNVHRTLHRGENVRRFDLGNFLRDLLGDVIGATGRTDIAVDERIEDVDVEAASATPLGLIVNELLTNAVKYAFADGRAGTLCVDLARDGDRVRVGISDDGPGFDISAMSEDTLGHSLITRLSQQMGGGAVWKSTPTGTRVTVDFKSDLAD